ncbi:hypothetical protein AXF42_Ash001465 [Apostasia shenzhenica]|uniref:HAT C-terminal dimerisation domain-containing protein n=1 Tax=Apostasia shenzhenica TaxID=1088818 RepID=A0A2I0AV02_9ASPA|nr:hypothetical protein AXF42_Ash001465 [Apostasia shenzhenica]
MQLQELTGHFTETTTELLFCMESLNPSNLFFTFDKVKLVKLARFYLLKFYSIRSSDNFAYLKGIDNLAKKLVKTNRHIIYPLVYLLIKLILTLPVATASVERVFSEMNIVKSRLRNKMGDLWMNDCLVTFIERDIFDKVDNELILQCFQNMKSHRGQL